MADNPVKFVDPLGDDWFVNNVDGEVVYLKNVSEVNGMAFTNEGFNGPASQYDRLGPNDMFGGEVIDSKGDNMLERSVFRVSNSEGFMNGQGYKKAENLDIQETEYTTRGGFGNGERVIQRVSDLKETSESKITYAKAPDLDKKIIKQETSDMGTYSSSKSITYNLTKRYGQPNSKTAEYGGNKSTFGVSNSNISTGTGIGGAFVKLIKTIFSK